MNTKVEHNKTAASDTAKADGLINKSANERDGACSWAGGKGMRATE